MVLKKHDVLPAYIAGPMRGIKEFNFPAFHQVHLDLWEQPILWFCPACHDETDKHFDASQYDGNEDLREIGFSLRAALRDDLSWIAEHAQLMFVLPGWENSTGAQIEVALAHALDIIVVPFGEPIDHGFREELTFQERLDRINAAALGRLRAAKVEAQQAVGEIPVENLRFDEEPIFEFPEDFWDDFDDEPVPYVPGEVRFEGFEDGSVEVTRADESGEVRTVSSTGGEKGKKPARFDLIPQGPLWQLAELYGKGAEKYEDRNWERGYAWSLSFAALNRHLWLFWSGEDIDEETGCPHLASVAWHAFALLQFMERNNDFDDRPIR